MKLLAILACTMGLQGCSLRPATGSLSPQPSNAAAEDSVAFSAVLQFLDKEGFDGTRYRIDPRPLPPDPSLISPGLRVSRSSDSLSAEGAIFGGMDQEILQARKRILKRRGILEADVIRDSRCPGVLTPHTNEKMAVLQRNCPVEPYFSIAIALPRMLEPGMYFVGDTATLQIAIRVVAISLSPNGATHRATDYVFLKESSGLRFVKRVQIAFIE